MRASDWDAALLADHRKHLRSEACRQTFDRMVAFAEALPNFNCSAGRQGRVRIFRYVDPISGECPFAFIVNRENLLFYVRKSGLSRVIGGFSALKSQVSAIKNHRGEWTVSVRTVEIAERLSMFLFGAALSALPDWRYQQDEAAEAAIWQRTDIGPTEKLNLVRSRRGQGVYRENLEKIEQSCRVTGVLDRRHLRASHIKPWCQCDDREKLDGFNGLLLSPHIEHLFGRGYISFSDAGEVLVSKTLNPEVLRSWGITLPRNVGSFHGEQCKYLEYHRREVFEQERGGRGQSDERAELNPKRVLRVGP